MAKQALHSGLVGHWVEMVVWTMFDDEKNIRIGEQGQVVNSYMLDGATAVDVLFGDGGTEQLWVSMAGRSFVLTPDREKLSALVCDHQIKRLKQERERMVEWVGQSEEGSTGHQKFTKRIAEIDSEMTDLLARHLEGAQS